MFTPTDPIPILVLILIIAPQESTVILSESDTLFESELGSANAPLKAGLLHSAHNNNPCVLNLFAVFFKVLLNKDVAD